MPVSMNIQLFYFDGCPSYERALSNLNEAKRQHGSNDSVDMVHVTSVEDAHAKQFLGSPTIRINGTDLGSAERFQAFLRSWVSYLPGGPTDCWLALDCADSSGAGSCTRVNVMRFVLAFAAFAALGEPCHRASCRRSEPSSPIVHTAVWCVCCGPCISVGGARAVGRQFVPWVTGHDVIFEPLTLAEVKQKIGECLIRSGI